MSQTSRARAERRLVLIAAGTAELRAAGAEHAQALAREVDWKQLLEGLRARRLLTILGPRLQELAGEHVSDEFAAELELAIANGRRQAALLGLVSQRVTGSLAEAGIASCPLKGTLLGETIYGDAGRRLSGDIDVLVAPDRLHAAVDVVRALGYAPPSDHVDAHGLPLLHFALVHEREELPPVELHWRVHWYERRFAGERLLPAAERPAQPWRPEPADELAALLLFYARDGFVDLRLATDLGAWWDTFGPTLAPRALSETIRPYPALAPVLSVAGRVAHKVVGLPLSPTLDGLEPPRVRGRLAMRLANPNPRTSAPQLYADIGMVDALLTPAGGFGAYVRRQLLPPRAVLRERAQRAPQRRAVTPVGHGARVLARYGMALPRLLHQHETTRPS